MLFVLKFYLLFSLCLKIRFSLFFACGYSICKLSRDQALFVLWFNFKLKTMLSLLFILISSFFLVTISKLDFIFSWSLLFDTSKYALSHHNFHSSFLTSCCKIKSKKYFNLYKNMVTILLYF